MTEAEWLGSTDPGLMLEHLRYSCRTSDRKLRLFACACVRRVWHLLRDRRGRDAVEVAERYADQEAPEEERVAHLRLAEAAKRAAPKVRGGAASGWAYRAAREACSWAGSGAFSASWHAADAVAREAIGGRRWTASTPQWRQEMKRQSVLLHCIVGNPFRPVLLDRSWLSSDVQALAQAAYDNRTLPAGTLEPARLALLADALEDAGCSDADILDHLRSPGPHVRGCWPLDLLLGKE